MLLDLAFLHFLPCYIDTSDCIHFFLDALSWMLFGFVTVESCPLSCPGLLKFELFSTIECSLDNHLEFSIIVDCLYASLFVLEFTTLVSRRCFSHLSSSCWEHLLIILFELILLTRWWTIDLTRLKVSYFITSRASNSLSLIIRPCLSHYFIELSLLFFVL